MKESVITCNIYASDLDKVISFKERKKLKNIAEALRVCIEFSDAHGALK
jgi:hypothetical protein